jgi:hypothetical protein
MTLSLNFRSGYPEDTGLRLPVRGDGAKPR